MVSDDTDSVVEAPTNWPCSRSLPEAFQNPSLSGAPRPPPAKKPHRTIHAYVLASFLETCCLIGLHGTNFQFERFIWIPIPSLRSLLQQCRWRSTCSCLGDLPGENRGKGWQSSSVITPGTIGKTVNKNQPHHQTKYLCGGKST